MIICECKGLRDGHIRELIQSGWNSIELLEIATGVGRDCGGCWTELARLLDEEAPVGGDTELTPSS